MKTDYWPQKWMIRIKNSNLSDDNKEVLLAFLKQNSGRFINLNIMPILNFISTINNVNLKNLNHDDMLLIFDWFYKTQWMHTPTSFVNIKQQLLKFLDFVDKTYGLGLNPKKEFSKFMKTRKIEEIKSIAEDLNYGTN
jgi:hypothetical protein